MARGRSLRLLLLTLALGVTIGARADFTPPPDYTASYDLDKGPLTLGEATLSYRGTDSGHYTYRMHTYAVGIASVFYSGEIHELSEGRITETGFRPERYVYHRTGDSHAKHAELRFDWDRGRVVNDVGDHPWSMKIPPGTLDRVVSPLQLMHDLTELDGRDSLTYRIADGGKLKTYHISVAGRERVDTPAGRFDTVQVVRRSSDGDRVTRLWCAPALHYLAVKVEHSDEDDGTFDLVLTKLQGMSIPKADRPVREPPLDLGHR